MLGWNPHDGFHPCLCKLIILVTNSLQFKDKIKIPTNLT